ncbi:MAG: universal stress protein [Melioribacteraceae bacterium]|nr:universal stress protein [Melioribacteraceae bacterium]MCF8353452.1 universal stress protein [Melioribacteraceae bacterium]MCF8393940.1 universal stress protein [Melioribacteraceae bacterium]MCF8419013.1 universal stress protein [Melioribacteraceae bacterium]
MYKIQKILVPIDFSDYSKGALKYAVDFAKHFGAKMYLVYVVEPMIYPADFSLGQVSIPSADFETNKRAEEELENLAKSEIPESIEVVTVIKTGKPFIEIIEYAAEVDIDLIMIATHGHTGVEHMLFGSTAEKVVRKAPCPVMTLREPIKGFKFQGE